MPAQERIAVCWCSAAGCPCLDQLLSAHEKFCPLQRWFGVSHFLTERCDTPATSQVRLFIQHTWANYLLQARYYVGDNGKQDMASAFKELRFWGDRHRASVTQVCYVLKRGRYKVLQEPEGKSCFCLPYTEDYPEQS